MCSSDLAEGGKLLNKNGERFMKKYAPEKMELATRDVVARSIYQEIIEGRGSENGGVYLDITLIPSTITTAIAANSLFIFPAFNIPLFPFIP